MATPATVEEYMKLPYARILTPDPAGGYAAEVLEFPGCFAQGETAEEAMANLERAAKAWVAATLEEGREIPEPTDDEGYSGRIALRLPRSLHRRVALQAMRDDTSINQVLVSAIAAWVGVEDFRKRIARDMTWRLFQKNVKKGARTSRDRFLLSSPAVRSDTASGVMAVR